MVRDQRRTRTFRMSSAEFDQVEEAATRIRVAPATFVRTAVLMVARRALSTDPLVMDLAKSLGPGPAGAKEIPGLG